MMVYLLFISLVSGYKFRGPKFATTSQRNEQKIRGLMSLWHSFVRCGIVQGNNDFQVIQIAVHFKKVRNLEYKIHKLTIRISGQDKSGTLNWKCNINLQNSNKIEPHT